MTSELINHLWQSTLFAAAAGLFTLAFRGNRAQVRFLLWLSASLKFFVPFALLMSVGSHLGWAPLAREIAPAAVSDTVVQIVEPFASGVVSQSNADSAAPLPDRGNSGPTSVALATLWACGFVGIALMRLRVALRIRRAVRASRLLQIPSSVEIRSSPGLLEPGVVGVLRPVLLLPEGIEERLTPSQLEAVLAHELCHVRRHDNLFAAMHMLVEAVFWFHPLVWWMGARLVEERERACDEGVLGMCSEPRDYAEAILRVCKLYVESPLACVAGVTGSNIKQRIEGIMHNRTGKSLNGVKKFLLAGAGLAAVALPIIVGIASVQVPVIQAQAPVARATPIVPIALPMRPLLAAEAHVSAPDPVSQPDYQGHRLVALLFDFDGMTIDEQTTARQNGIHFVRNQMTAADLGAIMAVSNGKSRIVQDYTGTPAVLESAIRALTPGDPGAPNTALTGITQAANLLAPLPEKKALVYFFVASPQSGAAGQAALQGAIDAAKKANVALFPIDASGFSPRLADAAAGALQDGYTGRHAYAEDMKGSSSPLATYQGAPGVDIELAERMSRDIAARNIAADLRSEITELERAIENQKLRLASLKKVFAPSYPDIRATEENLEALSARRARLEANTPTTIAGLPGAHASLQIYGAGEPLTLSIPLEGTSGRVDVISDIRTPDGGSAAALLESVPAGTRTFHAHFDLKAGSYTCHLLVKEQASGKTYGETINFDVK